MTYYFEIENKGFDTSLLLFSKFFSEPLLDYDYMKKEIDVIESEHHNQINQENIEMDNKNGKKIREYAVSMQYS